MNDFQLPAWGSSFNNNMSFGSEPMNIPTWDVPSLDTGSSGTTSALGSNVGYQPLEFGMNLPSFQLGLQGLGTLGNLWGTFQSSKLARDSFNFQKDFAQKNLANQIKSYNTALTDRATSRGFVQGDMKDTTQQYINDNKL